MKIEKLIYELEKITPKIFEELKANILKHEQVIILGNGGSSAIASHISQDYTKRLKIKSFTFSDSSRLSCYVNDYGYENAYLNFLKDFLSSKTLVILISSSGNSQNIINCAQFCKEKKIPFIILTGFDENNKCRDFKNDAILELWIDSDDYGIVECCHEIFLHSVL